jgi:hypothetical protein
MRGRVARTFCSNSLLTFRIWVRIGTSESWVDPIVGVALRAPLSDRWFARRFADVGGFGIGDASELSWQVYAGGG